MDNNFSELFDAKHINEFEELDLERTERKEPLCELYSSTDENENIVDIVSTSSTLEYEIHNHLDLDRRVTSSGRYHHIF